MQEAGGVGSGWGGACLMRGTQRWYLPARRPHVKTRHVQTITADLEAQQEPVETPDLGADMTEPPVPIPTSAGAAGQGRSCPFHRQEDLGSGP